MADKTKNTEILMVDSTRYRTRLTKKYITRKKWEEPNFNRIKSFIPGTIEKIYIREGQQLTCGEPMLVLEAMKMKNTISAPFDGKIKKIHTSEGAIVPKNAILVEFE